jgi:hypothetical protein
VSWLGTVLTAGHAVDQPQYEPGVPDAQQARGHETSTVLMGWDFEAQFLATQWLGFGLRIPVRLASIEASFTDQEGREIPGFESTHHRTETLIGLGDIGLTARLSLVPPAARLPWRLEVWGGITVPSGDIQADPFDLGRRGIEHQHVFFGSGTVNPSFGIDTGVDLGPVQLNAYASATVPAYENRFGYRAPRTLGVGLAAATGFGLADWRFVLGQQLFQEWPAIWNGTPAENSGRTNLILSTGVVWSPTDDLSFNAAIQVPYFTDTTTGSIQIPLVWSLGASYHWDIRGEWK